MFECLGCKAKDKQIEYLQRLVDQVLVKNGLGSVLPQKEGDGKEDLENVEIKETLDENNIVSYGGSE